MPISRAVLTMWVPAAHQCTLRLWESTRTPPPHTVTALSRTTALWSRVSPQYSRPVRRRPDQPACE